ncbi:hypothetical protein K7I13_07140 [Brucepastera parasyntrophica]|uniref:hypothetical protein n=1 Tax=Brucepastera parasyntrophica TaxID=2880008 RepID=UPI00210D7C91|nr:hypothetical protein [Brucepastera parasyntrophica]ULQ61019.1 hypothetical protein K7I13_07140 [Brucepastera parasyntrophica]
MIKKSLLIWLSIIPLAIINGALRQLVIEPLIGIKYANPISGLILCCLIFIVSFIFIPKLGKGTSKTYLYIGLLWIVLTITFETVLDLVMGNTITEIISAYNITTGNLWLMVVIFIGFAPWIAAKIKRII